MNAVTLADNRRLAVDRQEFPCRHLWEWTTLAENYWTHNGRKLTTDGNIRSGQVEACFARLSSHPA